MKLNRIAMGLALGCCLAGSAGAQTYTFNTLYSGSSVFALAPGSDDPVGTSLVDGDSFLWTIAATGGDYWRVVNNASVFPFMAFAVSESGARTSDFTLTLYRSGSSVFTFSETGSEQRFAHLGTNTVSLLAGLEFDTMELAYSLTTSIEDSFQNPPPFPGPIAATPSSLTPIFGTPEFNSQGNIVYGNIAAVPEPGTYALMLGGLGLLGGFVRTRRTRTTA